MPAAITLLRGINVGGHNVVKMDALRALYESMGLRGPRTYVQSGNVVFTTKERDLDRLGARIERGIASTFDASPTVIIRSSSEWKAIVARNPFAARGDVQPAKLIVMFLAADPGRAVRARVLALANGSDEVRMSGREVFMHFPNGVSGGKLPMATVERTLGAPATGRNWNTVTKLLAMAAALDAGPRA